MAEFGEPGKSTIGRFDPGQALEADDAPASERRARPAADPGGRRHRFLAKAIPEILWTASPEGVLDSFNPRWTEFTGLPTGSGRSKNWTRTLHPEDVPRWLEGWSKARGSSKNLTLDVRLRKHDGTYRWHLVRALPIRDRAGALRKWLGTCTDIDDQKRAEGMLGFLAEVGTLLASSLDYETTLAAVARMAVPHVADWCVVDILEPDGRLKRLALAHGDPIRVERAWELARLHPPTLGDARIAIRVLETGRTEMVESIDDSTRDADHLGMLRAQGCTSAIASALVARGRTLGVITFAMAESGRRYSSLDIPLVEDLARRSGMAVDNARLYREAGLAREQAEAANRAKDHFLAVLSHELRTPLTPVLAEVSAMLDDPATPESARGILEMTRRNVQLEARLIDDLLDLNRIVQGKLRLDRAVVDAHKLARDALEICRGGFEEGDLRVEVALDATRHHVKGDAARLQQIFWNLIKNAVKFTPKGGRVALRTRNEGTRLIVEVSDSGVGIGAEALSRIFDAFEQGDGSVTRRFGGLGLGLAISRSLAEAQGGRIVASSPGAGLGASFTLEFPSVEPLDVSQAGGPVADPDEVEGPGPLRILLVEDNLDTLQVMARLLARRGHSVAQADGMVVALGLAQKGDFDLLISDLGLPDGSGLELIRRLRATKAGPILGIALSGFGMDDDLRRTEQAGFLEHLVKPIDFPALEAAIRRVAARLERKT